MRQVQALPYYGDRRDCCRSRSSWYRNASPPRFTLYSSHEPLRWIGGSTCSLSWNRYRTGAIPHRRSVGCLYAAQQQRRQQTMQQAYGYAPGVAAGRSALEQHYAAYGMTSAPYTTPTAHVSSIESPTDLYAGAQVTSGSYRSLVTTGSTMKPSPVQGSDGGRPSSGEKGKPKSGKRSQQEQASLCTGRTPKEAQTHGAFDRQGRNHHYRGWNQQWYTGCVPLGVEDDKYWLSELQVYLRANFAEAFGATEDDIAAPMHGRNKPIALGQVGIRCMHCKRKCYCFIVLAFVALQTHDVFFFF